MRNNNISGLVKNCYWTFALLVMIGGMVFSVYALTAAYLSYPVSVSISVRREKKLVFPAVTICNMSPVKKSALQAADLSAASKSRKKRAPPVTPGRKHLSVSMLFDLLRQWVKCFMLLVGWIVCLSVKLTRWKVVIVNEYSSIFGENALVQWTLG